MSDKIPYEIQLEIIKRLSVKPLIRLKCQTKFLMKSNCYSPEFFDAYGARHTRPRSLLLRYKDNVDPYEVKYVSFVDDNDDTLTQQQVFAPNVTDLMKQFNDLKVTGSSHGLLCLYSTNKEMFLLWNPSLKKSVGIALPDTPLIGDAFCFSVCPVTRDPTIIMITTFNYVYVFTLSSRRWTGIPGSALTTRSINVESSLVVIDSCVYWVAREVTFVDGGPSFRYDYMIMSFDLIAREIEVVDIPRSCITNTPFSGRTFYVSKLLESLVLFVSGNEVNIPVYHVWKMEHDDSLTKLFTIKTPGSTINNILGFRKNGELLMETQKEGEEFAALEVYEPCSGCINNLGINGEKSSFFMDAYKETLLLMEQSDGCVYPEIDHGEDSYIAIP